MTRIPVRRRGRTAGAIALGVALLGASACGRDSTGPTDDGGGDVALGVGEYQIYGAGALLFPAAGATGATYLVVAQSATGTSGLSTAFSLTGVPGGEAAAAAPAAAALPAATPTRASAALRFHDGLRLREAALVSAARAAGAPFSAPAVRAPAVPPALGSRRTFKVCADLDCNTLKTVSATARYVGAHAAIFSDDTMPPGGGLTGTDLQAMGQQFDQELYPIDRANFGAESDIDNNGVVLILLTPKVNALVGQPDCSDAFITGYFYGADLTTDTRYNGGEVFYGMVPHPGDATFCAYSTALVRRLLQVTFVHEFQHMISFNQHVLVRGGDTEALWLNEGLSHIAEELAGLHYDSLGIDTTASRFYIGNLYNAYQYLSDPLASAIVTESPPGELSERGAVWLFLRHVIDRAGAATTRALVNTSLTGDANVEAAAGTRLATLLGRWALAVYAGDFPGFAAPADLRYQSWRFRSIFGQLNAQARADFPRAFPLIPVSATGGLVSVTGTVRSGSGVWVLVVQGANGAGFSLTFGPTGGGGFAAAVGAQAAVVRLR